MYPKAVNFLLLKTPFMTTFDNTHRINHFQILAFHPHHIISYQTQIFCDTLALTGLMLWLAGLHGWVGVKIGCAMLAILTTDACLVLEVAFYQPACLHVYTSARLYVKMGRLQLLATLTTADTCLVMAFYQTPCPYISVCLHVCM